ncbi:penicillin-insensitive murein endopeptidase [Methylomonas methanica]|uniref:Peptidase U6 penicillin-insensitive murein endopeptidase n=1 Tax=Methylomonas methanica (strain DSM 25384 / MC09) TaxID=857087 RepID=G0A1D7_METMM|nr:penicillin-insensitive murein endopeptidase [Methylomonas methanica]AEF98830.1 peptidase U6 penicillin-insensitive murein endopeptidase [Methylomonas methanica MC09]
MSKILLIAIYLFSGCTLADSVPQKWAKRTTPTVDLVPQSIGTYTNGCISGAVSLPLSGTGYQVMRLSRNRFYGHATLIQFIQQLGQVAADQQLGTLLIGDLGQARGGPTPSGHRSHQTGLDVDIWFLLSKQLDNRLLSANERETWGAPSVVDANSDTVDYRQWTQAHEKVLEAAARHPDVDRIFVNPSIKQELCTHKTAASAVWLRKIRPWWKHDDHFHVRLKCPKGNPYCQGQPAVPETDGCDASLAWWFSAEAKAPSKPGKPTPPPPLPALCEQVLNQ